MSLQIYAVTSTERWFRAEKVLFPLVAALGLGNLFQVRVISLCGATFTELVQVPLIGLQAAMPLQDMATSTAAFTFIRYLFPRLLCRSIKAV